METNNKDVFVAPRKTVAAIISLTPGFLGHYTDNLFHFD